MSIRSRRIRIFRQEWSGSNYFKKLKRTSAYFYAIAVFWYPLSCCWAPEAELAIAAAVACFPWGATARCDRTFHTSFESFSSRRVSTWQVEVSPTLLTNLIASITSRQRVVPSRRRCWSWSLPLITPTLSWMEEILRISEGSVGTSWSEERKKRRSLGLNWSFSSSFFLSSLLLYQRLEGE